MEYVSCIFIEFFDWQIMTPFDSRTLNVDTLDLAMCMRPFRGVCFACPESYAATATY